MIGRKWGLIKTGKQKFTVGPRPPINALIPQTMLESVISTLKKLLGPRLEPVVEQGPLYPAVRDALIEVQSYARSHGGTIELVSVSESGEVSVRFQGACKGCPVADITFRHGIELQLKTLVPGVTPVTRV